MQDIIIRNQFYTGNDQKVLSSYPALSEPLKLSLLGIHERALLAYGKQPTTPLYQLLFRQINGKDVTVPEECNDPETAVVYGYIHLLKGKYEDSISIVSSYPKHMECVGLMVLNFLFMNRPDMAAIEVDKLRSWADDATLSQLIEAWLAIFSGSESKLKEAIYVFEELASGKEASSKMLNGHAVCLLLSKRFGEAESVLLEAQTKDPKDVDVQANLVACLSALGKCDAAALHLKNVQTLQPNHKMAKRIAEKSLQFDKFALIYSR